MLVKNQTLSSVKFLQAYNIPFNVIELQQIPQNAFSIAQQYNCSIKSVIKTLLFLGSQFVMVSIAGDRKVDINKLKLVTNIPKLSLTDSRKLREVSGCEMNGVTPFFESKEKIIRVMDNSCLQQEIVNIGAGIPLQGIELKSADLKLIWPGIIADVAKQ